MKCRNCGAEVGLLDKVCPYCGSDNIEKVDSCFTRLRLVVKNSDIIDENTLKNETGAMGVFKKGTTVQVVYGMKINAVRAAVDQELGIGE